MKCKFYYTIAVLVLWLYGYPQAERRFISANGSDAYSGQITSPWSTISHAVSQLKPGDTLFVRGGIYEEGEIWIRDLYGMGGRNGQYLTIMAYQGEKPLFTNSRRGLIVNASYVRVQGLHFANGKEMYTVNWDRRSAHVAFIGNTFTGRPGYAAISLTGDDHLVQDNIIQLDGNTLDTQGHGIYVMEGARNIIRKNRISGMSGYGLHIYDERKSEDPAGFERIIQNVLIEGNIVFKSRERSGIIIGVGADGGPAYARNIIIRNNLVYDCRNAGIVVQGWSKIQDVQIDQNTLYNNPVAAIQIDGQVTGVKVRNNILYQLNSHLHMEVGSSVNQVQVDHNLYYPAPRNLSGASDQHPLEIDPAFINVAQGKFTLRQDSPAIDAGLDIGLPYFGKAPDLGAFEYDQQEIQESERSKESKSTFLHTVPNPFRQDTSIHYQLPQDENVTLDIFDLRGLHLRKLLSSFQSKGPHELMWEGHDKNGQNLPSGIYFCRLRTASLDLVSKIFRVL